MKKKILVLLLLLTGIGGAKETTALPGMPNNVIQKYIREVGGKWKLNRMRHLTIALEVRMNGLPFQATVYYQHPNRYKQVLLFAGDTVQVQLFDGEQAWELSFGSHKKLSDNASKAFRYQAYLFPELYFENEGVLAEVEGSEVVNGRELQKMRLTDADGYTFYTWYDKETGLKIRESYPVGDPTKGEVHETRILRYQEIKGIKFPAFKQVYTPGYTVSFGLLGVSFEKLPDHLFQVPGR